MFCLRIELKTKEFTLREKGSRTTNTQNQQKNIYKNREKRNIFTIEWIIYDAYYKFICFSLKYAYFLLRKYVQLEIMQTDGKRLTALP